MTYHISRTFYFFITTTDTHIHLTIHYMTRTNVRITTFSEKLTIVVVDCKTLFCELFLPGFPSLSSLMNYIMISKIMIFKAALT